MKRLTCVTLAALAIAGCSSGGSLTIRPSATALAQGAHSAQFRVNEAQAHLALGNVALASEGFRRALRDDPVSVSALVGLANCYDRMGRSDLSRDHYERALALRPADNSIYSAFAASLEKAGATQEAARLRREMTSRSGALPGISTSLAELVTALAQENSSLLTFGGQILKPASPITTTLQLRPDQRNGPRLERADLGEVVLVSGKGPHWQPLPMLASATRSPKLPHSAVNGALPLRVTILNAGSAEGQAARTRSRLQQLGWKTIAIANAGRKLERTEMLYPASLEKDGRRLARQLQVPVHARRSDSVDRIVLRLGRDAARGEGRT